MVTLHLGCCVILLCHHFNRNSIPSVVPNNMGKLNPGGRLSLIACGYSRSGLFDLVGRIRNEDRQGLANGRSCGE
jgi:hypothetical protein